MTLTPARPLAAESARVWALSSASQLNTDVRARSSTGFHNRDTLTSIAIVSCGSPLFHSNGTIANFQTAQYGNDAVRLAVAQSQLNIEQFGELASTDCA